MDNQNETINMENIKNLAKFLKKALDRLGSIIDILKYKKVTYDEVMKYFIKYKDDPSIVRGAILKEKDNGEIILYQIFLDKDDNIVCDKNKAPLGQKIISNELDSDLIEMFGNTDLIIVE
jgi:hypothetical protein